MREATARERLSIIDGEPHRDSPSFADEVRAGLTADEKSLPCRFLYDEAGSLLFEEICELPEYYVTRAEREILEQRAQDIADRYPSRATLVELGSGSSSKTRLLIEAFLRRHRALRYVPVDISRTMLEASAVALLERYDALEIRAIASEYADGLRRVRGEAGGPKLIAWLGSTIGNLERADAAAFLRGVRGSLGSGDRMLVGIDLRKDPAALEAAYDDSRGVTARFTLNLLERINVELGGDFDTSRFRHRAEYREDEGRVVIHAVSRCAQRVEIGELGLHVDFGEGEAIHVEDSFKYSPEEIDALARSAGLRTEARWLDSDARFSLNLLSPVA